MAGEPWPHAGERAPRLEAGAAEFDIGIPDRLIAGQRAVVGLFERDQS
jgi:hypothetical protein